MKHPLLPLVILAVAAGCGGKSSSKTTTAGGQAAAPIPAGIHACHFVVQGEPYGEHRCDVLAGSPAQLQKLSGMETFDGTLTASGDTVTLAGHMGSGDMVTTPGQDFTVALHKDGGGWTGTVEAKGGGESQGAGAGDWWLAGATFEIDDAAGYGGATYGDAWPQPDGE